MAFPKRALKVTRRAKTLHKPTIKSLPSDLLIEVVARVGSASVTDLANVRLSCKELDGASNDDYVLEHLSMEKFTGILWSKSKIDKATLLRRWKESGNPDTLYKQGMIEFFSHVKLESGLENLRRAAEKGHVEAHYVYGIILMCRGGEEGARGIEVLSSIKGFRSCRDKVKVFVWGMWINNPLIVAASLHKDAKTCPCYGRKQGWELEDTMCCCRFDREVEMFCNILMGRS